MVAGCNNDLISGTLNRGTRREGYNTQQHSSIIIILNLIKLLLMFIEVQGVPLATKPGISLIILTPMKILQ
jgi:hypothetical protein